VVLTGVTAGYGLGFNRATLFLVDSSRDKTTLVGKMGIGFTAEPEALDDWRKQTKMGLEDFRIYLQGLENGPYPLTPVGQLVQGLVIDISDGKKLADCLNAGQPYFTNDRDSVDLPPHVFVPRCAAWRWSEGGSLTRAHQNGRPTTWASRTTRYRGWPLPIRDRRDREKRSCGWRT